jgi:hypothetical protein
MYTKGNKNIKDKKKKKKNIIFCKNGVKIFASGDDFVQCVYPLGSTDLSTSAQMSSTPVIHTLT